MERRITAKTDKLFEFILKYQAKNGFPPSMREMGEFMGIRSTSTISYYLDYLAERGLIRRDVYKNRAIVILNGRRLRPQDGEMDSIDVSESESNFAQTTDSDIAMNCTAIPLLGQITAGQPILATENREEIYYMPNSMFKGSDLFMLKVRGNSMIDAGIYDGDMVIVRHQDNAENGDIVAALVDDSATIKRFFKEDSMYRLQPENSAMSPMYFKEVSIIGKVVGLIRKM